MQAKQTRKPHKERILAYAQAKGLITVAEIQRDLKIKQGSIGSALSGLLYDGAIEVASRNVQNEAGQITKSYRPVNQDKRRGLMSHFLSRPGK